MNSNSQTIRINLINDFRLSHALEVRDSEETRFLTPNESNENSNFPIAYIP